MLLESRVFSGHHTLRLRSEAVPVPRLLVVVADVAAWLGRPVELVADAVFAWSAVGAANCVVGVVVARSAIQLPMSRVRARHLAHHRRNRPCGYQILHEAGGRRPT